MNFRHQKKRELELSMTPMIDVVFLLLIFFMVTTSFDIITELKIILPEVNSKASVNKNIKNIGLTIDANGFFYITNKRLDNQKRATLAAALEQISGVSKKQAFVIYADAKTPHQAVITAMDVAESLGFKQIIFATNIYE